MLFLLFLICLPLSLLIRMNFYITDTAWQFKIYKCLTFIHAYNSSFYSVYSVSFRFCSDEFFFRFCYAFLCFGVFFVSITSMFRKDLPKCFKNDLNNYKLWINEIKFSLFLTFKLNWNVSLFVYLFVQSSSSEGDL